MEITNIRIFPFDTSVEGKSTRAFAEVELDGILVIRGIRILESKSGGLFLGFPSQKTRTGTYKDLVILKDKPFLSEVRSRIMAAYKETLPLPHDSTPNP